MDGLATVDYHIMDYLIQSVIFSNFVTIIVFAYVLFAIGDSLGVLI